MRRRSLTVALGLLLTLTAAAHAQTLTYEHNGAALFSITYPAGWLIDLDFQQEAKEAGAYTEGEPLELRIVEARPADDRHLWIGAWVVQLDAVAASIRPAR